MAARNCSLRFTENTNPGFFVVSFCCALILQGCSASQLYTAGQQMQKNACGRLVDIRDQQRCMERAEMSYDTYQRETDKTRSSE